MSKITPCLWFDGQAEEAFTFYASIFKDSKVTNVQRMPDGKALMVVADIAGQKLQGLNGGPHYKLTEAFSLSVNAKDQAEVDYYWSSLLEGGGEESQCAWLKDRFGVSWQIVPEALPRLLGDPDPARAGRAMQAMLKMRKIDVAALERAAAG